MNIQGEVKYVYNNILTKDGSPNKYPNFKFKVNEQEIVLWSAIKPSCLEVGKKVSVTVSASKKTGSLFVQTKPDKTPAIQEMPRDNQPDTSFDPAELTIQLNEVSREFDSDLTMAVKRPFNKDEYMFVMALLKSGIEAGKINVTKEEIDLKIKDYKFLFQMNFNS